MQATLPVRTWNPIWLGLVALLLAATVVIGAAVAFGVSRAFPASVDQAGAQTIEQSVVNHAIDERANAAGAQTPVSTYPMPDDKIGSRNLTQTRLVAPNAPEPGGVSRIVNVPR